MLRISPKIHAQIVAHCLAGLPDEACGLLAAVPSPVSGAELADHTIERCYPTRNAAASAKLYVVHPQDQLRADRDAEAGGLEIVGVFHSHTHTDAYPSATDVDQAPDPGWHYVIVSLRQAQPSLRSYRIVDGTVSEEPLLTAEQAGPGAPVEY
ncbi:MAG TPA: M67 family metallopeptidase [Acidimicrobiia bacterium]|nr:M67 family metallopeptidase [Acidimicrobiia bacterium]